jgi:hypothetical protein
MYKNRQGFLYAISILVGMSIINKLALKLTHGEMDKKNSRGKGFFLKNVLRS